LHIARADGPPGPLKEVREAMSKAGTQATGEERYILISADCHAGAGIDAYRAYLDPRYRDAFDAWRKTYRNPSREHLGGKKTKSWDSDERIRDMERDGGVVGEVVFPNTVPPFFSTGVFVSPPPGPEDFELKLAGIRAHNRWLAEWCAEHPARRAGVGLVLLNDIDEHGLRGGAFVPGVPDDAKHIKPLYAPDYDRLWAVMQDLGVIVSQHPATGGPDYGRYPAANAIWVSEMVFFSKRGFTHLILSGVFERFPDLRYVLTESGCAWVPALLAQLDGLHARMKSGSSGEVDFSRDFVLKEKPSFYARRNCWYGASFASPSEIRGREVVGVDRILWGSDYPHYEGTYPYTKEALRHTFAGIDPREVRMMLGENAARLYGFDLDELAALAARVGPTPAEIAQPLAEIPRDARSPAFAA
jgi:predicted TIM-barrel fold metal-dependent hydrolase